MSKRGLNWALCMLLAGGAAGCARALPQATATAVTHASSETATTTDTQITEEQARQLFTEAGRPAVPPDMEAIRAQLRAGTYDTATSATFAVILMSAMRGDDEMLDLLQKQKADLNQRDPQMGETALHQFVLYGFNDPVRVLLRHGADPDVYSLRSGTSPLVDALGEGQTELAELLLAAGADPNIEDRSFGHRPLHHAAIDDNTTAALLLLRHGADPALTSRKGLPPLHLAVSIPSPRVVTILLDAGADPLQLSGVKRTAVEVAQTRIAELDPAQPEVAGRRRAFESVLADLKKPRKKPVRPAAAR